MTTGLLSGKKVGSKERRGEEHSGWMRGEGGEEKRGEEMQGEARISEERRGEERRCEAR